MANLVELAEASDFTIDAQHVEMRRGAGKQRFEFGLAHAQTLIPLHRSADRAVEIEVVGKIKRFTRHAGAGQR
ncbi:MULTISPECIES: hypothetical protein [unclassified Mesorhizobium]|uniref:hypothetical protein n=1 Tax=unclassified Mesorhizobium TaxID=325217 RepID=UPI00142ED68B|nr:MULTISPECIES: hypothetical protein [unclassified Mesorhizobium]